MKIPKETASILIELGIEVLKALREWNKTIEATFIEEIEEKGDNDADRPENIQRNT